MRWARTASVALALWLTSASWLLAGCGSKPPPESYKTGVVPGISESEVASLLGKPSNTLPFSLPGIHATVLTYPFGQVALQEGKVVSVMVASDPRFVGANGVKLGMPEDAMKAALRSDHKHRSGHLDAYDVVAGDIITRTKDLYDQTDHVVYELAAANANDPLAPYSVISINLANDGGFAFLEAVTQAKIGGVYPGQHIDNFTSEPWSL